MQGWGLTSPETCRVSHHPEELMVQFEFKSRKKLNVPVWRHLGGKEFSYFGDGQPFCSLPAFSELDEVMVCFTQSTDLNVNLTPKHAYRNTQKNDQMSGHSIIQSSWHIKWRITDGKSINEEQQCSTYRNVITVTLTEWCNVRKRLRFTGNTLPLKCV